MNDVRMLAKYEMLWTLPIKIFGNRSFLRQLMAKQGEVEAHTMAVRVLGSRVPRMTFVLGFWSREATIHTYVSRKPGLSTTKKKWSSSPKLMAGKGYVWLREQPNQATVFLQQYRKGGRQNQIKFDLSFFSVFHGT